MLRSLGPLWLWPSLKCDGSAFPGKLINIFCLSALISVTWPRGLVNVLLSSSLPPGLLQILTVSLLSQEKVPPLGRQIGKRCCFCMAGPAPHQGERFGPWNVGLGVWPHATRFLGRAPLCSTQPTQPLMAALFVPLLICPRPVVVPNKTYFKVWSVRQTLLKTLILTTRV